MKTDTVSSLPDIVSMEAVLQAQRNIASYAHRTPVITCESLNEIVGHNLFFKCENFQKTGAFKFRGAINAISNLNETERAKGVVTHSSGNHAGALAAAAKRFGIDAYIVMPSNASRVKKAAVLEYGATVIECEPTFKSRIEESARVHLETGANMISPFNHPDVIAGQGTVAIEFHDQVPNLDIITTPIGGGGLTSGTCIATSHLKPNCKVVGVEPEAVNDAFRSRQSGKMEVNETTDTIADGLKTNMGDLTWPYIRDAVAKVVTVTDEEIVVAMKLMFERTKMLVEPSSAVGLAAAMDSRMADVSSRKNIGIVISGGNVDLGNLPW